MFDKLHFRRAGTRSSLCGKARAGAPAFEVFDDVPREVAKSVCLRCFKGGDVETPAAKERERRSVDLRVRGRRYMSLGHDK